MRTQIVLFLVLYLALSSCRKNFKKLQHHTSKAYSEVPTGITVDFIIIGASTSGCILANKLSENPEWTVVVLDAGNPHENKDKSKIWYPKVDSKFVYKKQKNFGQSTEIGPVVPDSDSFKTSWIRDNSFYAKSNLKDSNLLRDLGIIDWDKRTLLSHYKNIETVNNISIQDYEFRGHSGPILIEEPKRSKYDNACLEACKEIGYDHIDYNGRTQLGYSLVQQRTKNSEKEELYLRPVRFRKNLKIWTNCFVTKILLKEPEDGCPIAEGVEFIFESTKRKIFARNEVILAAGSYNSPKILMLSGIGPQDHLEALGIRVFKDLPVGRNLANHLAYLGMFFKKTLSGDRTYNTHEMSKFMKGTSSSPFDGGVVLHAKSPYSKHLHPDYPDLRITMSPTYLPDPFQGYIFRKMLNITEEFYEDVYWSLEGKYSAGVALTLIKPSSKGRVKLRSSDPQDDPELLGNFLHQKRDVKILIWGIKLIEELAKTKALDERGLKLERIKIPCCEGIPVDTMEYWKCYFKYATYICNVPSGSCSMGEDDGGSVVDSSLRVHGIPNLRVVGSHIYPFPPTGDKFTMDAMIAEKCFEVIRKTVE